jgi:PAS domain S-box-containing protein
MATSDRDTDPATVNLQEGTALLARLGAGVDPSATRSAPGQPDVQLHIAEAKYRALIEQIPAVTFMASLDGGLNEVYVSPQIESLLGFTQEEWMSDPVLWFHRLHPDDRALWNQEFARGCASGGPFRAECRFLSRTGEVVWVHGEARLIRDEAGRPILLQGVAFDITEAKRAEEVIKTSLREKEVLLKEIHHRVKNNLQITSSLLRLQASQIADQTVRQSLGDSQDRIRSMALVHEMLYRSDDLARIDLGSYVRSLVLHLFRSYNMQARRVTPVLQVDEILIGVDHAIPCGLIINELVSNALKHAFPDGRAGQLWVQLDASGHLLELRVRDDGIGMPRDLSVEAAPSLGLQLVATLIDQIGGKLSVRHDGGAEFIVSFPRPSRVA